MKKIIFSSGLPRAMSTLMVNILANNPRIGGGETSALLEYLFGARGNYSTVPEVKSALTKKIMHESFLNFCRQGMYGYADSITSKEIYLDKSRGWVHYFGFLKEIMPDAKVIVMIRDLRSIVASFEKKWRENPSIADARENPANQQFITMDSRVNAWLESPPISISMKRIYNALQTKSIDKMLVVKAEDLCKDPKATMQRVYNFIGEPYFDIDYKNIQQVTVENDRTSDYGIYGDHSIRPNIEQLKNDYNDILGKDISNNIRANNKWFYEAFNYF